MKKQELIKKIYDANDEAIEIYVAKPNYHGRPHTDNIESAYSIDLDDYGDDIKVDEFIMDEDEYNETICANQSYSYSDLYYEDEKVNIIIIL